MGVVLFGPDGRPTTSRSSNQYTGSKSPGDLSNWATFTSDPNEFLKLTYEQITDRCSTLYKTFFHARATVNKPLSYSIGEGLFFDSMPDWGFLGKTDTKENREWAKKFSGLLHLEKQHDNFYEKILLLARSALITGDAHAYFLREETEDGKPFDFIPSGCWDIDWKYNQKDKATMGILHDEYGRRKGFRKVNGNSIQFKDSDNHQNAVMLMFRELPGQMRGYSINFPTISLGKKVDRIINATVERMVMEASQVGFFNTSVSNPGAQAERLAKQAMGASGTERSGELKPVGTSLNPGTMYQFENDEGMTFAPPVTPSNSFGLFNEWALKYFSLSSGYGPNFLQGSYPTSYTSHKGEVNDAFKKVKQQRETIIRYIENIVNLEYLKSFIYRGDLNVIPEFWSDYRVRLAYLKGVFLGPLPGHISPLQEIKAMIEADKAGYKTPSQNSQVFGNDFWDMIEGWKVQQDELGRKWNENDGEELTKDMIAGENGEKKKIEPVAKNKKIVRGWSLRRRR